MSGQLEPNSFKDFQDRFVALQKEAQSYGLVSVVAMSDSDPLSENEVQWCSYQGGLSASMGLAEFAKLYMARCCD